MRRIADILPLRSAAERATEDLPALMMRAQEIAATVIHGTHAQRKSGAGEKFWQFREHTNSDRPQDIDWRQSAKTDHVFIRQKEWQTTQKTYLWCAQGKSMSYRSAPSLPRKQDAARILTIALALLLRESDEQIALFGESKSGHSAAHIEKIAARLLTHKGKDDLPNAKDTPFSDRASFIAIGDFLPPLDKIEDALSPIAAKTKSGLIIQTLDPCEVDLTLSGRIKFEGTDASESETIDNAASIKDEYNARINEHIQGLKTLCAKWGWHHALHISGSPEKETLQNLITFYEAAS